MIKFIDKEELENEVLKSEKLCLVDFFAEWCGPCNMLAPVLDELSKLEEYAGKLEIYKIDIDKNPEVSMDYGVEVVPTIMFIKGGKIVTTETGYLDEDALKALINEHI